jgi:hypothetical protein
MADQSTIESVAQKFERWAESLSGEEQAALAEWWQRANWDVSAHRSDEGWWREPGAWAERWSASWSS